MKVLVKELKGGVKSFLIWTLSVAFLVAICVFMFPEMKEKMDSVSDLFASMGAFSSAFGMDRLGMGTLLGFYGVECGTMLSLGAALFAASVGISMVGKEEKGRTAEFLFSLSLSRKRVLLEKYLAAAIECIAFHVVNFIIAIVSILMIGEELPIQELLLLHSAYLILTLVVVSVTFAMGAFDKINALGSGMGVVILFYFVSLIANITEKAKILSYFSPFSFTDGASIVLDKALSWGRIFLWLGISISCVVISIIHFDRKDLKC